MQLLLLLLLGKILIQAAAGPCIETQRSHCDAPNGASCYGRHHAVRVLRPDAVRLLVIHVRLSPCRPLPHVHWRGNEIGNYSLELSSFSVSVTASQPYMFISCEAERYSITR